MRTEWTDNSPAAVLLQGMLAWAVPLHIENLKRLSWPHLKRLAEENCDVIAEKGDIILYRQKGESAAAFNRLAESLAILSFLPGGVRFLGLHFETKRDESLWPVSGRSLRSK